jgi:hypothetical protein
MDAQFRREFLYIMETQPMKKPIIMAALCGGLFFSVLTPASAVTVDYSNTTGHSVNLDPTDGCGGGVVGCFSFSSGSNLEVTSGTASGLFGSVSGNFGVGTITTTTTPQGPLETASVTGTGNLNIFDGSFTLTADLNWVDITTFGTAGSLNTLGTANLTNILYSGSNIDLFALASAGTGTQTATFQFSSPTSLTELFTNRSSTTSTSFSGSISAVPIPASIWLFGTGVLGLAGLARKKTVKDL